MTETAASEAFTVLWENEYVRVLSYQAAPGSTVTQRGHPNSVVVALTAMHHRAAGGDSLDLAAGDAAWLAANSGIGRSAGDAAERAIVVELKGSAAGKPEAEAGSPFLLSDARLRELFGAEIVDAGVVLSAHDAEASRWGDDVAYVAQLERHRGWVASASVGVNVRTGRWSFSCDADAGVCIHSYGLVRAALEDPAFARQIEDGLAELA